MYDVDVMEKSMFYYCFCYVVLKVMYLGIGYVMYVVIFVYYQGLNLLKCLDFKNFYLVVRNIWCVCLECEIILQIFCNNCQVMQI